MLARPGCSRCVHERDRGVVSLEGAAEVRLGQAVVRRAGRDRGLRDVRQFAGADLVSVRVYTINPKREELFARQAVIEIATIVGSGLF